MVALEGYWTDIFGPLKVGDFCLVELGLFVDGEFDGDLFASWVPNRFLLRESAAFTV